MLLQKNTTIQLNLESTSKLNTFLALDFGTSDSSLRSIVEKYRENMDGIGAFIYIERYRGVK